MNELMIFKKPNSKEEKPLPAKPSKDVCVFACFLCICFHSNTNSSTNGKFNIKTNASSCSTERRNGLCFSNYYSTLLHKAKTQESNKTILALSNFDMTQYVYVTYIILYI